MNRVRNIVRRRSTGVWIAGLLAAAAAANLGGCGQKITVPTPVGLFSVAGYYFDSSHLEQQPVQVALVNGMLFVLDGTGSLIKQTTKFDEVGRATGLPQPTAFCADQNGRYVFIWCQGDGSLHVLKSDSLIARETEALPYVESVTGMVADSLGVQAVPGALTFVYLSDPAAGVIHRYAYTEGGGLTPYGLLARKSGLGARSVLQPAGMVVDREGMILVCDRDSSRNWVIRFNPTPSPADVAPLWYDMEPMRGRVVTFGDSCSTPPSAADLTLGNAPDCTPGDHTPGISKESGEFTLPSGVTTDGAGRIYVADFGNDRVQIFKPTGEFVSLTGGADKMPGPTSLGCTDERPRGRWNYGAYLFVLTPGDRLVQKFISLDQYHDLNPGKPPPQ